MASNRSELVETLALHGLVGSAVLGELDSLFAGSTPPTQATTSALGVVKQSAAVANLSAQTFTDIAGAQTAVNAIVAKINALLAAERTSGQLAT